MVLGNTDLWTIQLLEALCVTGEVEVGGGIIDGYREGGGWEPASGPGLVQTFPGENSPDTHSSISAFPGHRELSLRELSPHHCAAAGPIPGATVPNLGTRTLFLVATFMCTMSFSQILWPHTYRSSGHWFHWVSLSTDRIENYLVIFKQEGEGEEEEETTKSEKPTAQSRLREYLLR